MLGLGVDPMRFLALFLLAVSTAAAYITPPDHVFIDGRMLLTSSCPMASYPWKGPAPRLSEHTQEGVSDSRPLEAFWEIKEGRLYLLAVSAYRFDGFSPSRSVGLRDLMPERVEEGRVFAEWYSGDFDVLERERVDPRLYLRPEDAPPMRVVVRKFRVERGHVTEVPDPGRPNAP